MPIGPAFVVTAGCSNISGKRCAGDRVCGVFHVCAFSMGIRSTEYIIKNRKRKKKGKEEE
jgi:hypothetical protein